MNFDIRLAACFTSPVQWVHVRTIIIVVIVFVLVLCGHADSSLLGALIKKP